MISVFNNIGKWFEHKPERQDLEKEMSSPLIEEYVFCDKKISCIEEKTQSYIQSTYDSITNWFEYKPEIKDLTNETSISLFPSLQKKITSISEKVIAYLKEGPEHKVPPRWHRWAYIISSQAFGLGAMFLFPKQPLLSFIAFESMATSIKGETKSQGKLAKRIHKAQAKLEAKEKSQAKAKAELERSTLDLSEIKDQSETTVRSETTERSELSDKSETEKTVMQTTVDKIKKVWKEHGIKITHYSMLIATVAAAATIQWAVLPIWGLQDAALLATYFGIAYKCSSIDVKGWMKGDDEDGDDSDNGDLEKDVKKLQKEVIHLKEELDKLKPIEPTTPKEIDLESL